MEICIDFDGTSTTHEYPFIGKEIGAVRVLKLLIEKGHKLILFTMRSGKELEDAVNWYKENGLELYGINKNPTQRFWTKSPKAHAKLYIDDAGIGCPLIFNEEYSDRPYVDWDKVEIILKEKGIL